MSDRKKGILRFFRKFRGREVREKKSGSGGSRETIHLSRPHWKRSLAVLPFLNEDQGPERDYLCDGLTDELIEALSSIRELKVSARRSAFAFKGQGISPLEAGRRLGVSAVLDGNVRLSGDRFRVAARLIDVTNGSVLWSGEIDRAPADIPVVRDEITLAAVKALGVKASEGELSGLTKRLTADREAYDLFLTARHLLNKEKEGDIRKSIELFGKALEKDPDYAPGWAGLAEAYLRLLDDPSTPPREAYPTARAASRKALELDSGLAEAHCLEAAVRIFSELDLHGSEEAFQRAIVLKPGYAPAYHWYGRVLFFQARFTQAIEMLRRALELDPLSPIINRNLGAALFFARDYNRAEDQLQRTQKMSPDFPYTHIMLGWVQLEKGLNDKAVEEFKKETGIASWLAEYWIHISNARRGDRERLWLFHRDYEKRLALFSPFWTAIVYAELGDHWKVCEWMMNAYEQKDPWFLYIKLMSSLDECRSDPKSVALLKRVGLA